MTPIEKIIHALSIEFPPEFADPIRQLQAESAAIARQRDELLAACRAQEELIHILYAEASPNLVGQLNVIDQVSDTMRQARAAIAATGQGEVGDG